MDLRIRVYGSGSSITLLSSVILRAAVLQAYNKSCFVDVRLDVDVYIRLCCSLHSAFIKKKMQLQVETTMATQEDIQEVAMPTEVPTGSELDWLMSDGKIMTVR